MANSTAPFKAVIFDLDGVVTQTSAVHRQAWSEMFNSYLLSLAEEGGAKIEPFGDADYLEYVDGRPRYDGVKAFLESRSLSLPYGMETDAPGTNSICGLGNLKDKLFGSILERDGVEVYPSTVSLVAELQRENVLVGIASSSRNCRSVLQRVGLQERFEVCVDGVVSAEQGLRGKPCPDRFILAAPLLGVLPEESVVVEDAVSGVQAAHAGRIGMIVGLAREDNIQDLVSAGADTVFIDLEGVSVADLSRMYREKHR